MNTTRDNLLQQTNQLRADGWLEAAISQYVTDLEALSIVGDETGINNLWTDLHQIGSPTFTRLWAQVGEASFADRLQSLFKILGAQLDEFNFMQLSSVANQHYTLPTDEAGLLAYFDFVEELTEVVRAENPTGELTDIYTHQLRYWLDKPVIDWLDAQHIKTGAFSSPRRFFEKWVKKHHLTHKAFATSNPILHNRFRVPNNAGTAHNLALSLKNINIKDQIIGEHGYHIELIFDYTGQLVSQWNVMETYADGFINADPDQYDDEHGLQIIANTDSANYAQASGNDHVRLDVEPAAYPKHLESDLRVRAKQRFRPLTKAEFNGQTKNKWQTNIL
ncbi:MAG: DUF3114 domain-containing protein [Lactobacillaceae bacterium]|jgi:hypothetical protein|nr:DUF3114 domain-containing protein [Lactobacillaceae bacterium]